METLKITKADLNARNEYAAADSLEFDGHFGTVRILAPPAAGSVEKSA